MEENELYNRIGETDLNPTYKDGQVYQHTDINQMLGILKTAINENYYDIQRLLNGEKTVGNSEKLDGATLSRYIDEELQADDDKIPSSQQAKAYMDALFAGYSAPVRGVDYWTETDQQQIVSDTASNVIEEITPDLEEALAAKANINDIPTKLSDFQNDGVFITNAVNDLQNYYLKSETYTKTETDNLLNNKVNSSDIVDSLISTETQKPLSANQGKTLNDLINSVLPLQPKNIKVHYINSGTNKGDCIVIETNNKNMIIDFGATTDGNPVINYLINNNITKIDYALVTHYHTDHIGGSLATGLINVLNNENLNFNECLFLLPPSLDTAKWQGTAASGYNNNRNAIISALTNKGISYREPVEDEVIELDVNTNIRLINCYNVTNWDIYYANTFHANGSVDDGLTELNNFSIVTELKHGKNIFLFTGDIEPIAQGIIKDKIYTCDVYKIEHHGANDTTNDTYLSKITPKISINMNTENSNYDNRTLQYLRSKNIPIYTTHESGDIVIISDKYNIYPSSTNPPYYQNMELAKYLKANNIIGFYDLYTITQYTLLPGDNLNDYITPGTYRSARGSDTGSILNKPDIIDGTSGGFILDVRQLSNPNIVMQTLYSTTRYGFIFNRIKRIIADDGHGNIETEWTEWFLINNLNSKYLGISIRTNADLNDYTTPGIYYASGSSVTNSLSNCCVTGTGFKLEVECLNDANIVRQTIKSHSTSSNTYVRTRFGSTSLGFNWQNWYKVEMTEIIPSQ